MNAPDHRVRPPLDPFRPHSVLIERECSQAGEIVSVATVFLVNRECPWRCLYCDLWKNTLTETVPPGALPAQIDFALAQPNVRTTRQIKLYNAGSFFDPRAIPPEEFPAIAAQLDRFDRVIVESHPALIGDAIPRFLDLLRHHAPRITLEVAMGLEVADDAILAKLNKHMTLEMFARAAEFLREHGIALRAFVMLKPPFVRSDQDALLLARRSIDFAFDCGATAVSLIPARFGTDELERLAQTSDFAPPAFATLEAAVDDAMTLRPRRGRVFADLWDLERLAECKHCFPSRRERLEQMNLYQRAWPRVSCAFCGPTLNRAPASRSAEIELKS